MAVKLGDAIVFFSGNMKGLQKDQQGAEKETQSWVKRLGTGVNKFLGKALVAGVGAATSAVVGLGGVFAAATVKAASLQGISDTFFSLADGAKLAELRSASMNRVLDADLMKTYNSAVLSVSQSFADDMPNAMQYMGKIADATGQDVGYLLDSYQLGIARLSPMILDNLGIQVNLGEANAAYAKSLGVTVEELTKEQQQMALNAQVIGLLESKTAGMADTSNNAATKIDQLKTMAGNLFVQLGQVGIPILTAFLGPLVSFAERVGPQAAIWLEKVAALVGFFISSLKAAREDGERLTDWIEELPEFLRPAAIFITEIITVIDRFKEAIQANFSVMDALKIAVRSVFGDEFADAIVVIEEFIGKVVSFVKDHGPAIKSVLLAIGAVLAGAGIISGIAAVAAAIAALFNPITLIIGVVALLAAAWTENWGGIQEKTAAALEFIQDVVLTALESVQMFWARHGDAITAVLENTWGIIKDLFAAFSSAFEGDWENFGRKLRDVWEKYWENVKTIISSIDWWKLGSSVVQGIVSGILSGAGAVGRAALSIAKAASDAVSGFWDSRSPSRLFATLGETASQGLAQGMLEDQNLVARAGAQLGAAGAAGAAGAMTTIDQSDQSTNITLHGNYAPQPEVTMVDNARVLALQMGAI